MKEIQQFLKQCKNSSYYSQNLKFETNNGNFKQIQIKNRDLPNFVVKCPQIKIHFQQEIINKLKNDLNKSKKSRHGLFIGKKVQGGVFIIQQIRYINSNQEEDIGACQVSQEALCIGFFIQKQQNCETFVKRFTSQLTKCIQTKLQVVFSKTSHQSARSELNEIQKTLFKHVRCFITFDQRQSYINLTKTLFMPDIKFLLKEVHLNPLKFCQTVAYTKAMKFQKKYQYGYLSLSIPKQIQRMNQVRFVMVDRSDPGQNTQTKIDTMTMIGLWVAVQKFSSKQQQKAYFWAIIIQYLRNQSIKKKSINIPRSGIIFMVQKPRRSSSFIFQIPEQSKWFLNYQPQTILFSNASIKLPQQITFSDQQIIFEQDKEQSQIESLANKSLVKNNHMSNNNINNLYNNSKEDNIYQYIPQQQVYQSYLYNNSNNNNPCDMSLSKSSVDNRSVKSNEQKDLQINLLKKQLQFYKARCEMLQRMVNNPSLPMMQLQQLQLMSQMNNPLINHMSMNNHNSQFQMMSSNTPNNFHNFNNNSFGLTRNQNLVGINNLNNNEDEYSNVNTINSANFNQMPSENLIYKNHKNLQLHKSNSSPSSTNIQINRILEDSQYQEEILPPQPQPILPISNKKDTAFNKKKTIQIQYQQQHQLNELQLQQNHQNENQAKQKKIKYNNNKNHYVEVQYQDYKNISFAQQNQFQQHNFVSSASSSTSAYKQKKDQNTSLEDSQLQIFGKSPQFKSINSHTQNKYKEVIEFSFDSKDNKCQSFGKGNQNYLKKNNLHNNNQSQKNKDLNVDFQIDDIKTVKSSQRRFTSNTTTIQNKKYLQKKQPESPEKLFKRIQRQKKYLYHNQDFENSIKDDNIQEKNIPTMTKIQKEKEIPPKFYQQEIANIQRQKQKEKQKIKQKQKKLGSNLNKAGSDSDEDQDLRKIIQKRKKQKLK